MSEMNIEEVKRRVNEFQWYHTIDLGNGLITPGQYDHRPLLKHYGLPDDLTGKTVLDIGPAHGFFAFEFEKRRAVRVVTVELPQWSDHDGSAVLKSGFERGQGISRMKITCMALWSLRFAHVAPKWSDFFTISTMSARRRSVSSTLCSVAVY